MRTQITIIASINNRQVYIRKLQGYQSIKGLELAIKNTVEHDFKNYDCKIIKGF